MSSLKEDRKTTQASSGMLGWKAACDSMQPCTGPQAIPVREHLPMLCWAHHPSPRYKQLPDIFILSDSFVKLSRRAEPVQFTPGRSPSSETPRPGGFQNSDLSRSQEPTDHVYISPAFWGRGVRSVRLCPTDTATAVAAQVQGSACALRGGCSVFSIRRQKSTIEHRGGGARVVGL